MYSLVAQICKFEITIQFQTGKQSLLVLLPFDLLGIRPGQMLDTVLNTVEENNQMLKRREQKSSQVQMSANESVASRGGSHSSEGTSSQTGKPKYNYLDNRRFIY